MTRNLRTTDTSGLDMTIRAVPIGTFENECHTEIIKHIDINNKSPVLESFGDINRGPISIAGPSVARELSQEGDTHNISKVAFTSGEEATAQGPSWEKERAMITTCSSLTGEEMQLMMLLFLKLQFVAEKKGAG
ncbi:uncharacterized protein LOC119573777 [Penaeus monodon]|uniref:uncharacterized protein LOC119573777 n=1 Tax=Penaeus monodon TaxID=6687 RepID=UPI0018A7014D|nr:uncharacterized protein LOC119573777 [Penaeus monodon]